MNRFTDNIYLKKLDLSAKSRQTPQNRLFETRLVRFARLQASPGLANEVIFLMIYLKCVNYIQNSDRPPLSRLFGTRLVRFARWHASPGLANEAL